jgi:hypothetical protein
MADEIIGVDSTEAMTQKTTTEKIECATQHSVAQSEAFNIRKQISSTTYEVAIYFSPESRETLDDKILRLVCNGALNEEQP